MGLQKKCAWKVQETTSVVEAPGVTLEIVETPFTKHKNNVCRIFPHEWMKGIVMQ
jgi:hypothetical protein